MGKFVQLGGSENPVGYCHLHKFTISKNQMKTKGCMEKNCRRFEKYEDHPYWIVKAQKKALAKQHRQEKKAVEKETNRQVDKSKLVKAIDYCHNCPPGKKEAVEYCSQCPYSKECMAGIMDMIYYYFHNYYKGTFEEFLNDDRGAKNE